jgi:hypothetical protein|tara:strand:- start:913 stop:1347 length:435 start_codon:yes stop_codon:yes gene_type:complete
MYRFSFAIVSLITFSCSANTNAIDERHILDQKIKAFQFLSKYHHQLHIMIGEEDGDIDNAFNELLAALSSNNNPELIPVKRAANRVNELSTESISVQRLDYLVDYYQSGLSMQIEGVMRGYGYLETFSIEDALTLYDSLKEKNI